MHKLVPLAVIFVCALGLWGSVGADERSRSLSTSRAGFDQTIESHAAAMIKKGRQIFRYDTFGNEEFWGKTLRLHQAITGEKLGGVGPGVSPKTALEVGLKVDSEALPKSVISALKAGKVDLADPATTLALLKANAVLGVTGSYDKNGNLSSLGIQCALCHSTVDNSFAPGIGRRLDGWPNRDLNVGAIIALAPDLSVVTKLLNADDATVRKVLRSWGPGKFDAELFLDGKAMRPDGKSGATLIPPAFGFAGISSGTYTGWGNVTYWNAFVANLEMHGQGTFFDPRLNNAERFPVAAKNRFGDVRAKVDLITSKLASLQFYQLAMPAPTPPSGSFDRAKAKQGKALFEGKAACATCHVPPLFSEPGYAMHTAEEIGIDDFQAKRSPDQRYRTTPLAGLFTRMKGGFYHDGRFADLEAVVEHYNRHKKLGLDAGETQALIEYLKSL